MKRKACVIEGGSGGVSIHRKCRRCSSPAREGLSLCQAHPEWEREYRAKSKRFKKFVPDFVSDPERLPKRPPGG